MRYAWNGGFHPAVHAHASQDLDLPPSSLGMLEEARNLLDSIRSLAGQGLTPGQIAAQLTLIEDGVRNVLAMGPHAYNPGLGILHDQVMFPFVLLLVNPVPPLSAGKLRRPRETSFPGPSGSAVWSGDSPV